MTLKDGDIQLSGISALLANNNPVATPFCG